MSALSLRQWNRTLLMRQHLLTRVDEDIIEVLDRCVGLQAQDPLAPFFALSSRIEPFAPDELDALLIERDVVRMASLRSTILLMDTADARWIRSLAQRTLDAELVNVHAKRLVAADAVAISESARELLTGQSRTAKDLGVALSERFPEESVATLVAVARCALALVQIPPRGTWSGHAGVAYALLDDWAGDGEPAIRGVEAIRELIRLYLRGFGPASIKGIQGWSGLTGLRHIIEAMESDWELTRLDGPDGAELFDLEGLPLADEDTDAPVRLVAPYDHVIVAQADRVRIADDKLYRATTAPNGLSPGFVLVDGRLAGTWKVTKGRVTVEFMATISRSAQHALDEEVLRLDTLLTTRP